MKVSQDLNASLRLPEYRLRRDSLEATSENLPGLLGALAGERRLKILRMLAEGTLDATHMARELAVPADVVQQDLNVLAEAGLVRADPHATEAYQLAQHAVRLLNSALTYGLLGAASPQHNGTSVEVIPVTPLACTVCDNRDFVARVLGQLNTALSDAHNYHRQIQEMSSQVLTAHEAERKRIARELHDDTAQALTSIVVRLRLLERSTSDPVVLQNVAELRELTTAALESVRRMAMDLRPAALDDLGLVPALQAYCQRFSASWSIQVSVNVAGLQRRLPPDVELVLYRVVQEALTNVVKHASASAATVGLSRRRNEVIVRIADNGIGFEPGQESPFAGTGLGLFGMQERLALVGGDLKVETSRGNGTTVSARVPLRTNRARLGRTK